MARPLELLAGLLAASLGLICAAYIHGAAHSRSLGAAAASFGVTGQLGEIDRGLAVSAVVLVGLGLAAYVHSMFQIRGALFLLWACTVAFVGMALYAVASTRPVWTVIWLFVPGWLTGAVFVAGLLAIVACAASAVPWALLRWEGTDGAEDGAPVSTSRGN